MRCWQNRGELRARAPVSRGPAQGREEEARVRGETEALYIRTSYFQYDWDVAKFDDLCSFCESFCSEKWHDYQFCCIHIHLFTFIFQFGELIEHHITNGTIVPVEITCSLLERAMTQSDKNNFLIGEHSTVQYSTVQYCTVQYNTVQYNTVQYSTGPWHRATRTISS